MIFEELKMKRKEPRITVGLTLSPYLVEEARKRNLNISRICEQALLSIPEYYPRQNKAESSEVLNSCSFQENEAGPTGIEPVAYGLRVRRSNLTELRAQPFSLGTEHWLRDIELTVSYRWEFNSEHLPSFACAK